MVSQVASKIERREPWLGAVAWVVVAIGWATQVIDLTVIRLLLAFGPLIVVPLALDLLKWQAPRAEALRRFARRLIIPGGLAASAALLLPDGPAAGALAVIWLGVCGAISLSALLEFVDGGRPNMPTLVRLAAAAYLGFGAGWLVVSRLDLRPLDFSPAIVELTAVHFHFTGFAAVLLAATTVSRARGPNEVRFSTAAALGIVVAMPLIATGITFSQPIATAGSSFLGLSIISLVIAHASMIRRGDLPPPQRLLLTISSASILAGMALAIQWAVGLQLGTPALSIDQMAKTHGVLNSFGFVLCGLLTWHTTPLVRRER